MSNYSVSMSSLNLKALPFPAATSWKEIRDDPSMCYVCFNIHPRSAETVVPASLNVIAYASPTNSSCYRASELLQGNDRQGLFNEDGELRKFISFRLEISLVEMNQSSLAGCPTCYLLKQVLEVRFNDAVNFEDPNLFIWVILCEKNILQIEMRREEEEHLSFTHSLPWEFRALERLPEFPHLELYTLPGKAIPYVITPAAYLACSLLTVLTKGRPCPWPTIGCLMNKENPWTTAGPVLGGIAGHICPESSPDVLYETIRRWSMECSIKHPVCMYADRKMSSALTPQRMLDIASVNNGVRLVESKGWFTADYVAIVHSWENLGSYSLSDGDTIRLNELPQSLRDAIGIAKTLEYRYLWVDALCADPNPGTSPYAKVLATASIYRHASLVISTPGSFDAHEGLFSQRKDFSTLTGSWPDGRDFQVFVRDDHLHYLNYRARDQMSCIKAPRATKEYAARHMQSFNSGPHFLQELMATRVLRLDRDEATFDCLTGVSCECGMLLVEQDFIHHPLRCIVKHGYKYVTGSTSVPPPEASSFHRGLLFGSDPSHTHHDRWRDLVACFSQTTFVEGTDRLLALSAVAFRWANRITGKYLAGLWETELTNHLRWYPDEYHILKQASTDIRAHQRRPSWSWISCDRGVTWGLTSLEHITSFVDIDLARSSCDTDFDKPFGTVRCGHLFVTGSIMEGTVSPGISAIVKYSKKGSETTGIMDIEHLDRPEQAPEIITKGVVFLRLSTQNWTGNAHDDDLALVLIKAEDQDLCCHDRQVWKLHAAGQVFKRVALFQKYPHRAWNHETEARKMTMCII
jgi:hypothetical protein